MASRFRDLTGARILDDTARTRIQLRRLEALDADNSGEDPHADVQLKTTSTLFGGASTSSNAKLRGEEQSMKDKRKRRHLEGMIQRAKRGVAALVDDEQLALQSGQSCKKMRYPNAVAPASRYPPRPLCAVCGFAATYTCVQCGTRYCCIKCLETHKETRCLKWTA